MSECKTVHGVFQMLQIKQDDKWVTVIDMRPEAVERWYRNIPARLDKWQQERSEVATD